MPVPGLLAAIGAVEKRVLLIGGRRKSMGSSPKCCCPFWSLNLGCLMLLPWGEGVLLVPLSGDKAICQSHHVCLHSCARASPLLELGVDGIGGWELNYLTLSYKCKSSCSNKVNSNNYTNLTVDGANEHLMCKVKSI